MRLREETLLGERARQQEDGSEDSVWANQVMAQENNEVELHDDAVVDEVGEHEPEDPERAAHMQNYLDIMASERGFSRTVENPTVLNKATSLWIERAYARAKVAKGFVGKIKAALPVKGFKVEAWRKVVQARSDAVDAMKQAVVSAGGDKNMSALYERMATEFELLNVRDRADLLKYEEKIKPKKEKRSERGQKIMDRRKKNKEIKKERKVAKRNESSVGAESVETEAVDDSDEEEAARIAKEKKAKKKAEKKSGKKKKKGGKKKKR